MEKTLQELCETPFDELTAEENEIVHLYLIGYHPDDIAEALDIPQRTYYYRMKTICQKLGVLTYRQITIKWFEMLKAIAFNL